MGVWIEIPLPGVVNAVPLVTPFVGVWIEIFLLILMLLSAHVTPFVGVWIEIQATISHNPLISASLPLWECGLKSILRIHTPHPAVTPFVGVWIEISVPLFDCGQCAVTPFVGVWIEIVLSEEPTS